MEAFKERLIAESKELDERLEKIADFLWSDAFEDIDPVQQSLLHIQANAMSTYSQVLYQRMKHLGMIETGDQ